MIVVQSPVTRLSAQELESAIGIQLLYFYNVLWGNPETAATDLFGVPPDRFAIRMNVARPTVSALFSVFTAWHGYGGWGAESSSRRFFGESDVGKSLS